MLGAGRFSPKEGDPNVTVVDYLLVIDLKGLLPKMLVHTVSVEVLRVLQANSVLDFDFAFGVILASQLFK